MCVCLLRYRGRNKREGQRYMQPAVNTALTSRGRLPAIIHTHRQRKGAGNNEGDCQKSEKVKTDG